LTRPHAHPLALLGAHGEPVLSRRRRRADRRAFHLHLPARGRSTPALRLSGRPGIRDRRKPRPGADPPLHRKKGARLRGALEKAGIPVVSLYPEKLEQFDDYIRKLALLTGTEENAEALLKDFHARLDAIKSRTAALTPKARVFFESTETELRTVTEDSMAGMAIRYAGGENVAGDAPAVSEGSSIAAFGAERILEKADAIDVYVSQRGAMNAGGDEHSIAIRPGFSAVKAVREGRVCLINEKLVSSPSFGT
jgi:iron complex transport system substrate-binding protein